MPTTRERLHSVDLLRGVVMVLMALDHVRDHFSDSLFVFDAAGLSRASVPLFLTRWVTHFCAPVFVFLAGTGAFLSLSRGRSKGELTRYLLTRGLFLVVLDPTVIRHSWFWDGNWRFTFGQVIWAIGWSMILLALLIHLPRWITVAFGLVLVCGHNLLDMAQVEPTSVWGMIWTILHVRGGLQPVGGFFFFVMYPLIPWLGVMALGYALGPLLMGEPGGRRSRLLTIGMSAMLGFVILRWTNVYGDPTPWTAQDDPYRTAMSFVNCEKYPPSLLFLLMTLGPAIAALGLMDRRPGSLLRPIVLFGRVPMFYYLIHVPVIHVVAGFAQFHRFGWNAFFINMEEPPGNFGFGLPIVYAAWIGIVVLLYFPCRWFADLKARRNDWWLGYL